MEPEAIPLPPVDTGFCLPYDLIRYVAGYPESYVQRYAQEYARAAVLAERERCARVCEEVNATTGECPEMAVYCAATIRSGTAPAQEEK
jgi:hypothetical protein